MVSACVAAVVLSAGLRDARPNAAVVSLAAAAQRQAADSPARAARCRLRSAAYQYGHLNRADRDPRESLVTDPRASTWPHGSSIGGLLGVASSFEMGHVKVEW